MTDDDEPGFVVCVEWTTPPIMDDNVRGTCAVCGAAVQHRPKVPVLPKLCISCAVPAMEEQGDNLRIGVTRDAFAEAYAYIEKQLKKLRH